MYILGFSCFYHDSAACLLKDGEIVAAVQEERFTRVKHDWRFPENAIRHCLTEAGITIDDVDLVVFHEKPLLKFERVLETFLSVAPRGIVAFVDTIPSWLKQKLRVPDILNKTFGYHGTILFAEHHLAHAASSYFISPFEESAILTIDGVGEWATAAYGSACGNRITLTHELRFPHSLGLLYSAFTAYLGFEVNDAEYKVMGMAAYGKPRYTHLLKENVVQLREDGSIRLNLDYFPFLYGRRMFNGNLECLFDLPARKPESELNQKHFDIAASLQQLTEEVVLTMGGHVQRATGMKNICLAGGVALNSVANGRLLREGPFDNIFIQPAAGDAGAAVGAAFLGWHHHLSRHERYVLHNTYLGPACTETDVEPLFEEIETAGCSCTKLENESLLRQVASMLASGKVIAWVQGRMEFGPRALGNRSILADPRDPKMKDRVNEKIKFREMFRPFAPAVTFEDAPQYFGFSGESPYMLFTVPTTSYVIPAVTHVDGSARVQTVKRDDNPLFYDLLREFEKLSGVPVLMNTSLNLRGEPVVCTPRDAWETFRRSGMDALVIGNRLISRENNNG